MALVEIGASVLWPGFAGIGSWSASTATSVTLDAAGEYTGIAVCAPQDLAISHVCLRNGTAVGSPVAEIRIETIDATTGLPTGTLWAANTNVSTGTLVSNTTAIYALGATANISRGQWFAVKILYTSGTSFLVSKNRELILSTVSGIYQIENTGTPATATLSGGMSLAIGSSATSFYHIAGCLPYVSDQTVAFDDSTAGDARGARFRIPFDCKIRGLLAHAGSVVAANYNLKLLNDAGTLIHSTAHDGDIQVLATGDILTRFDADLSISRNTWYRIVFEPSETGTNVRYVTFTVLADTQGALACGANMHATTFTTAGGWVDSAITTIPFFDLLVSHVDDGTGAGGGLLAHPGMRGGFI